jgi:hypothetical protein
MREELIKFETAKLAKEKGFTYAGMITAFGKTWSYGKCYDRDGKLIHPKKYTPENEHYPAPTQALLQRWLREKHGIHVSIRRLIPGDWYEYNDFVYEKDQERHLDDTIGNEWPSYEEALENALVEGLKSIK